MAIHTEDAITKLASEGRAEFNVTTMTFDLSKLRWVKRIIGQGMSFVAVENKHKSSSTIYFPSYLFTGEILKWSLPFLSMAALIHQFHRELYPRSM